MEKNAVQVTHTRKHWISLERCFNKSENDFGAVVALHRCNDSLYRMNAFRGLSSLRIGGAEDETSLKS